MYIYVLSFQISFQVLITHDFNSTVPEGSNISVATLLSINEGESLSVKYHDLTVIADDDVTNTNTVSVLVILTQ